MDELRKLDLFCEFIDLQSKIYELLTISADSEEQALNIKRHIKMYHCVKAFALRLERDERAFRKCYDHVNRMSAELHEKFKLADSEKARRGHVGDLVSLGTLRSFARELSEK